MKKPSLEEMIRDVFDPGAEEQVLLLMEHGEYCWPGP